VAVIPNRSDSGTNDLHFDASANPEGVAALAASVRAYAQTVSPAPPVPPAPPLPPPAPEGSVITQPPGFAGEIAAFIYNAAHRPVPEVAVVATLGLLAGICGRQWCLPGTGLNLYLVLVARSAIGKEAMHLGVSKLVRACRRRFDKADQFVSFDDFASGQALIKGCIAQPSFVNVVGEIGHKFTAMALDREPAIKTLRSQMTKLYTKSGPDGIAGGIAYSNQENSVSAGFSIAYSVMGETTPGTFYESLTSDMMRDGFLSRFNVIEYTGDRPEKNPAPLEQPSAALVQQLASIMEQAHALMLKDMAQPVSWTAEAGAMMEAFDLECDHKIREAGDDEAQRQMWNRAHLKTLRIAGLLAVADNYLNPTITAAHFSWAMDLTRRDIAVFSKRLQSGDIGEGTDDGRERKLLQLCQQYLLMRPDEVPGYGKAFEEMRKRAVIPRKYLQLRTQRLAAFEKYPRGQKAALDIAIQTAIENGHLREAPKDRLQDDFGFGGKAYLMLQGEQFRTILPDWWDRVLQAMEATKESHTAQG
jgi:hypothetical protein